MASSGTPFSSKYSSACSARSRELNTPTAVSNWSPSETHFPGASNAGFPCKPKQTKLYTRFRFSRESVRRLGRATFRGHDSLPVANPFEERVGVRQMDFGHVFRECSHHFVVTYATVDIQRPNIVICTTPVKTRATLAGHRECFLFGKLQRRRPTGSFSNGRGKGKEPTGFRRCEEVTMGWCLRFSRGCTQLCEIHREEVDREACAENNPHQFRIQRNGKDQLRDAEQPD